MLSRSLKSHLVLAPSTSVGKSIISTALAIAANGVGDRVFYLKPIGTGGVQDDDELHIRRFSPATETRTLYHFDEPVSPHLAVQRSASKAFPTDQEFRANVTRTADEFSRSIHGGQRGTMIIESAGGVHSPALSSTSQLDLYRPLFPPAILVASHELGGISTTISAYESLLLRGYTVESIVVFHEEYYSNWEYFKSYFEQDRGIHVGVMPFTPPARSPSSAQDLITMQRYYASITPAMTDVVHKLEELHQARITQLEEAPRKSMDKFWWPFVQHGNVKSEREVMVIDSASGDFFSVFQAQYSSSAPLTASTPTSALSSESLIPPAPTTSSPSLLQPMFDGSASWWTQSLGHAHPALTLAAAHASGRYGHILFPTATSIPSLQLAETLLESVGRNNYRTKDTEQGKGEHWASRVFYSDDGSTGMEVALKMALRAYSKREQLSLAAIPSSSSRTTRAVPEPELAVLGLKGSYHGDTIGVMEACESNVFNETVEWYKGQKGFWLSVPTVKIEAGGEIVVRCVEDGPVVASFPTLASVYDVEHRLQHDGLAAVYRSRIITAITMRYARSPIKFGALILEPLVMGAGGMIFVDPLFQRVLIDVVRTDTKLFPAHSNISNSLPAFDSTPVWQGLPIIYDEVFIGLRRLGRLSGSSFLNASPDIAVYAKILTGGLVPLAVTLASDSVFQSFWGANKVDALLHGHSYSAHPIGCAVAGKSLEIMGRLEQDGLFDAAKLDWSCTGGAPERVTSSTVVEKSGTEAMFSLWSHSFVTAVSSLPAVSGVMTLGTVLAIHLAVPATSAGGYSSNVAESVLQRLRFGPAFDIQAGIASSGADQTRILGPAFNIHARPLGNIIYFMSSLNSTPEALRAVEEALLESLSTPAQ